MLPAGWRIEWLSEGTPTDGVLSLRSRDHAGVESLSRSFWDAGPAGLGLAGEGFPLGAHTVALDRFPTLDELWCLYMLARCEQGSGDARPKRWEALVRYVHDARLGYVLDRVAAEKAILPLYQALVAHHLASEPPARSAFLDDALAMCAHLDGRLEAGADLLGDAHFDGEARFARHLAVLEKDSAIYREDVARGRRFIATVPPAPGSRLAAARELGLLVLDRPVASQFKTWARRDPDAPGGEGYPLLLVADEGGSYVLSADPLRRVKVDWLAEGLTALERERGGADELWYDGSRHEGTLIAAPRAGSVLSLDEVLGHLRERLGLREASRAAGGGSAWRWAAAGVAIAAAAAMSWFGVGGSPMVGLPPNTPAAASGEAERGAGASVSAARAERAPDDLVEPRRVRDGAKGEPLPADRVKAVASESSSRPRHALVAGSCAYSGERALDAPCRDARSVRRLLVEHYGYPPESIIYLIDRPEPGEKTDGAPTAREMKRQVERFRERFGDEENASFLFYYSGHGGYVSGAHDDYGVLQPTGFFDTYANEPYSHRGWDMQTLIDDIKKGVPARHLMLVIDACYSGWAGAKGDGDFDDRVRALWRERAEVILTAASKGQRAWEDAREERARAWGGHSALTAFLLRGLERREGGSVEADENGDGIVTDEELAAYLRAAVPPSVALNKSDAKQTPQFFRLDERYAKSGQFLFVPEPRR